MSTVIASLRSAGKALTFKDFILTTVYPPALTPTGVPVKCNGSVATTFLSPTSSKSHMQKLITYFVN
jgi:hypothetical protein